MYYIYLYYSSILYLCLSFSHSHSHTHTHTHTCFALSATALVLSNKLGSSMPSISHRASTSSILSSGSKQRSVGGSLLLISNNAKFSAFRMFCSRLCVFVCVCVCVCVRVFYLLCCAYYICYVCYV